MNYGELIKDSFRLTLRNRYLWFFGFFAGGVGANFGSNVPTSFPGDSQNFENFDPGSMTISPALIAQGGLGGGTVALVVALIVMMVAHPLFIPPKMIEAE